MTAIVEISHAPVVVGSTCGTRSSKINAEDDPSAIAAWLGRHANKPATFSNCRKESERFYLWVESQAMRLADVRHEDVLRYRTFLGNPPKDWVGKVPRRRLDPRWCPFRGPLSPASVRQAEIVLSGMFAWLVDAEYLRFNPFTLSSRSKDSRPRTVERFLTHAQLQVVFDTIEAMPVERPHDRRRAARDRWLVHLLYRTGMRASEAATHTMGAFARMESPSGERWALAITGKGNKPRSIPVTQALSDELHRFRSALGLRPTPVPGEETPLLPSLRGGASLTRGGVYRALEAILAAAHERCMDPIDKDNLRRASTHWFRHSRGTHLVESGASLNTVRDLLGHASLTTTSLYVHGDFERMQDDIERIEHGGAVPDRN